MGLRRPGQPPEPLKKTGKPLRQPTVQRTALSGRYQNLCLDAKGFFEAKDYDTALKVYTQAATLAPPGDLNALKGMCRCTRKTARKALKKGDYIQVQTLLDELMKNPRVHPLLTGKDYLVLAEAALENQALAHCANALQKALEIKPELAEAAHALQKRLKTEQLHQDMRGMQF